MTLFADVTIKIANVPAETPKEATEKAIEIAQSHELTRQLQINKPMPEVEYTEFGDHFSGALVDFPDDPEHEKSVFLNEFLNVEYDVLKKTFCASCPELAVAVKNIETASRNLDAGDWLQRRLAAAIAELQEVTQVLILRENEDDND